QLLLAGMHGQSFCLNGMLGPERIGNDADERGLLDATISLEAGPRVTIGFNLDLGEEQGWVPSALPASKPRTARWSGAAGYGRWQLAERFALIARAEGFEDRD